jgi:hypothetical protein
VLLRFWWRQPFAEGRDKTPIKMRFLRKADKPLTADACVDAVTISCDRVPLTADSAATCRQDRNPMSLTSLLTDLHSRVVGRSVEKRRQ